VTLPTREEHRDPQSLRDRIVDTAIDLAEQEGWEDLRLRKVAERCGVDLPDVLSEGLGQFPRRKAVLPV
jgi:AcrR family transcriptional regulator